MSGSSNDERREEPLRGAIAGAERRLTEFEKAARQTRDQLASLRGQLDELTRRPATPPTTSRPQHRPAFSSAEKIAIFRSLFRGREDVYSVRFVAKKTGKGRLRAGVRQQVRARRLRASGGN